MTALAICSSSLTSGNKPPLIHYSGFFAKSTDGYLHHIRLLFTLPLYIYVDSPPEKAIYGHYSLTSWRPAVGGGTGARGALLPCRGILGAWMGLKLNFAVSFASINSKVDLTA